MVRLDKFTPLNYFEIWGPRWHDRKVLLAAHRIGTHNKVVFTKAPSLGEDPYYISGAVVKKYNKETNGKMLCYAVPLDEFEPLELSEHSVHELY